MLNTLEFVEKELIMIRDALIELRSSPIVPNTSALLPVTQANVEAPVIIRSGRHWTPEQLQSLIQLKAIGSTYKAIGLRIGKTPKQCRDRYSVHCRTKI